MVDVDKGMVDMDMVNRKFLVNFIYLGRLPRIIWRTCLDSLVLLCLCWCWCLSWCLCIIDVDVGVQNHSCCGVLPLTWTGGLRVAFGKFHVNFIVVCHFDTSLWFRGENHIDGQKWLNFYWIFLKLIFAALYLCRVSLGSRWGVPGSAQRMSS